MEDKEMKQFTLTGLLLVTGFCFLLFTLLLKIVDGVNIKFFFWVGLIALGGGLLSGVATMMTRANNRDKSNLAP